ncbi:MAG: cupin domain-containing protein [Myxococcales bacterium]|nr:cupin domain-containing protein [Myxococcales bacterium]
MEIDHFEIDVGQSLVGVPHHPGTQEYIYVEKGRVRMHVDGEKIIVPKGHVFTFPADQKHSYYNDGTSACIGLSVVSLQS